ncbi:DUF2793 domain-containing protein [Ancylobacter sp. VNQ12]|uniref:DUF2793 domain-containing protein n=1 Tax=Ancylobacter sp. VNQ12 TaxID=3400920 RepID=UPI003C019044
MSNNYYSAGTATVVNGSTAVSGTGTTWLTWGLMAGDTLSIDGVSVPIASVDSNTSLTLAYGWPGADAMAVAHVVLYTAARRSGADIMVKVRELLGHVGLIEANVPFYRVQTVGSNTPPGSPTTGDSYAVGTSPAGAWSGHANNLAGWTGSAWEFTAPFGGWTAWNAADDKLYIYDGGVWSVTGSVAAAAAEAARDDVFNGAFSGYRNKIINGEFRIAQRGSSFTSVTNGQYTLDRWYALVSGGAMNVSQAAVSASAAERDSFLFHISAAVTGSGTAILGLGQKIEGVDALIGDVTLTFRAKASTALNISASLNQNFGSGGSTQVVVATPIFNLTTSWQRFSVKLTLDSIVSKTIGAGHYLETLFYLSGGALGTNAGTIDIADVSVVAGDFTASTGRLEPRHISQTIAMCQRYYYRGTPGLNFNQFTTAAGQAASWPIKFPQTMRATPTVAFIGGTPTLNGYGNVQVDTPTVDGCRLIAFNSSGAVATANAVFGAGQAIEAYAEL